MAVTDLALLDGRYQLLRRLGGRAATPLMVASDLRRGTVVCLRLRQFGTTMASFAAVPPLCAPAERGVDGPLLPYDFGVDEDVAYLVRDYVPGSTLDQLLSAAEPPALRTLIGILRRAGQALLAAEADGFPHPGLLPEHILIAADGSVRVTGFDAIGPGIAPPPTHRAGRGLAGVLRSVLAAYAPATIPPALRPLAGGTGRRVAAPELSALVHALARIEAGLDGRNVATGLTRAVRRFVPACAARLRHLGPLLHPYLVLLVLLAAIALLTHGRLSAVAGAGRVYVYTVPALASSIAPAAPAAPQCLASAPALTRVVSDGTCVASSLGAPAQQPVALPAARAPEGINSTVERAGGTAPHATTPTSSGQPPTSAPGAPALAASPPATAASPEVAAPAAEPAAPVKRPTLRQAFIAAPARLTSTAAPRAALPRETGRGLTTRSVPTARSAAVPARVPAATRSTATTSTQATVPTQRATNVNQPVTAVHTTAAGIRTTATASAATTKGR